MEQAPIRLNAIWPLSESEAYAVGTMGTILRGNADDWSPIVSGTTAELLAVWAGRPGNAYAVGADGTILHSNGDVWSAESSPTRDSLTAVWGSSTGVVFAVGTHGTIIQRNGSGWRSLPSGTRDNLFSVWGSSATDAYTVGAHGQILHWDGGRWTRSSSGVTVELHDVWGFSASDVFAVGDSGTVLRFDGARWNVGTLGTGWMRAVWGSTAANVFAIDSRGILYHFDGTRWSEATGLGGTNCLDMSGYPNGEPIAISAQYRTQIQPGPRVGPGDFGATAVSRFRSASWNEVPIPSIQQLNAVWGSGAGLVLAAGNKGALLQRVEGRWLPMPSATSATLRGLWGSSDRDVFVVGDAGTILRFDGAGWHPMPSGVTDTLYSVWGRSSSDVYAAAAKGILHFDGSQWSPLPLYGTLDTLISGRSLSGLEASAPISGMWGTSATMLLVSPDHHGQPGWIAQFDGSTWAALGKGALCRGHSCLPPPAGGIQVDTRCFSGLGRDAMFEGSNVGIVWRGEVIPGVRGDTTQWHEVSAAAGSVSSVWARSTTDVYAAWGLGDASYSTKTGLLIRHFDGSTWTDMAIPDIRDQAGTSPEILALWGDRDRVFGVGHGGVILSVRTR